MAIFNEVDAFSQLCNATKSVAANRVGMPAADTASLHLALLSFAVDVYPGAMLASPKQFPSEGQRHLILPFLSVL